MAKEKNEKEEEYFIDEDDDSEEFEPPSRDMTGVFDKVISPKGYDKEVSRDIKLTKTNFNDRQYLIRIKVLIEMCEKYGLTKAVRFYRALHNYYANILASEGGFTAKNLISARQFIRKEIDSGKSGKRGLFK